MFISRTKKNDLLVRSLILFFAIVAPVSSQAAAPPAAASVGYDVNTFSSHFDGDIDFTNSRTHGFNWYLAKWSGSKLTPESDLALNNDSTVTILASNDGANYAIGSAAPGRAPASSKNWIGVAFGGGGYFEAEIEFHSPPGPVALSAGFPSWWLEPIEHMLSPTLDQWQGQALGYEHFVELDIFEYNQWKRHSKNVYSGALHEWFGIYRKSCLPHPFCQVTNYDRTSSYQNYKIGAPAQTNFDEFHKFGVLWVPATAHSNGYVQYYFDGQPTEDKVSWSLFNNAPPPPGKKPWDFGTLDRQHMVLILGTGPDFPMKIRAVNVWQRSAGMDLHQ